MNSVHIFHFSSSFIAKAAALGLLTLGVFLPYQASGMTPPALTLKAGDYTKTLSSHDTARFMRLDTQIIYDPSLRSEITDPAFCPSEKILCSLSLSRILQQRTHTVVKSFIDTTALGAFVKTLAEDVIQEPADVKFSVADGSVIIAEPEKVGRRLQEEESVALLIRALATSETKTITLPTEITQPKLVASDRERLGLKELIGEGHTDFKGSPKNRIYNINRALEQFENIIIAPGEEFSFVDYLGEVDGEHGYLPELVIKNNQTTPEFGGGICQVSTTVFRAAIYSGLKITERRNHAYPVKYYAPYGMDATIYIPKPDLAFVNNTPGAILVQPTIEGTTLTVRFYGTNDGRVTTVDGPHILARGGDGSMKTVFTQEVNTGDGENFIRDSFWSNYKSPSLYPHPGEETNYTEKPSGWSKKQWDEYKKIRS